MSEDAGRALVIGVGNASRGDDAVGLRVAHRVAELIAERKIANVAVLESPPDAMALLETWSGAASVVIVDATSSEAPPGTITRFDGRAAPLPARTLIASTHALGVPEAIELGRALGRLPKRLVVIGVEGAGFAIATELSPAVANAVDGAVEQVLEALSSEEP